MVLKSLSSLVIFALLLSVSTAFGGRKALSPDDGAVLSPDATDAPASSPDADFGYVRLNTKSPKVISLAKFAIDQYNKEHNSNLVYESVFEALATGHARGTEYDLVVAATDNNVLNDYDVVVLFERNVNKLVLFKENQ